MFGMAVAALAVMSCVGDALCSSDEGASYGQGALIVLPVRGHEILRVGGHEVAR